MFLNPFEILSVQQLSVCTIIGARKVISFSNLFSVFQVEEPLYQVMCGEQYTLSDQVVAPASCTYISFVLGIFGYLNYLLPRTRQYILETLVKGLQRLEYRGYDSAGVAFDDDLTQGLQGKPVLKTRYIYIADIHSQNFILLF